MSISVKTNEPNYCSKYEGMPSGDQFCDNIDEIQKMSPIEARAVELLTKPQNLPIILMTGSGLFSLMAFTQRYPLMFMFKGKSPHGR